MINILDVRICVWNHTYVQEHICARCIVQEYYIYPNQDGWIDPSSSVSGCCPRSKPPEVLSRATGQRSMTTKPDGSRVGLFDKSPPLYIWSICKHWNIYFLETGVMKITPTYLVNLTQLEFLLVLLL